MATLSLSPRLLGEPQDDPLLAEIVEAGEALQARERTMFAALEVLYREGILEEPTIRAMRKQREQDGKRLIERYKLLLQRYRSLLQHPGQASGPQAVSPRERAHRTHLVEAILRQVDGLERLYLHQKVELKISTDLAAVREQIAHLEAVVREYRGSAVAYTSEEKLVELRKAERLLARDHRRAVTESEVMSLETELLVEEVLLGDKEGDEHREAARQIQVKETRRGRLIEELKSLPSRPPTRRGTSSLRLGWDGDEDL